MTDFSVSDKVTIITGGTGVLGSSIASHFAQKRAKIILIGRNQDKLDNQISLLKKSGAYVTGFICDILDERALSTTRDKIVRDLGEIDFLINVAGGNTPEATQKPDQSIFDLQIKDIDSAIALNLQGSLYPSLVFGEAMAKEGSGVIVNISSMAAYSSISRVLGYSIGKSGVNTMTQWLACEMSSRYGDKVRVNAIAPGFFIGDQNRKLLLNDDGSLTERSEKVIGKTPMGRFGDISELNGAVQFLCSDAASFITGVVLPVDGGFSTFSGV